jgi:hypothetical protein
VIATTHRTNSLLLVARIGLFVTLGACGSHDAPVIRDSGDAISRTKEGDAITRAKAASARGERVPGVAELDTSPKPGQGLPYPGTWAPRSTYRDSLFTIERPASSTVESRAADAAYGRPSRDVIITRLPDCRWYCAVTIDIWRDSSGGGVPAVVRDLTAPDTTQDADIQPGDARIIDSLPLGCDAAVHLEMNCGDCGLRALLTSYHGWMARIEYTSDDREGYTPALTEHLAAVARSFRWRR